MESILTSGSILKLVLTSASGNFPIIVVMLSQESGIGAGGSLSKKWPRRPRHWYKNSHWRQQGLLILELWSFCVNEVHMRNSMEGTCWSEFEGLTAEYWTCAANLGWSSYCCEQGCITAVNPVRRQKVLRLNLSPSTLLGGPGNRLEGLEKVQARISPGVGWEEQSP